jgi:hypothetical protein
VHHRADSWAVVDPTLTSLAAVAPCAYRGSWVDRSVSGGRTSVRWMSPES